MGKIAGSYNPFKGGVTNLISNMGSSSTIDDYSTFVHEIQHVHFNLFSVIGEIIEVLRMELRCTPKIDERHRKQIKDIMNILCEGFQGLQEIYANSMELLWVETYQGREAADSVYERKSEKYKVYSQKFQEVIKGCHSLEEKRNLIHRLCIIAASPDMTAVQFSELLEDTGRMKEYFKNEGNMERKLESIIIKYRENPAAVKVDSTIKLRELWTLMVKSQILIYYRWLMDMGYKIIDAMGTGTFEQMIAEHYQEFLIKKTEVFEFELAGKTMDILYETWKEEYGCVLKKHSRLLYPKENYLLLGCSDAGKYIGQEVTEEELGEAIRKMKAVVVDFKEFDIRKNRPAYFLAPGVPIFVLMTNYPQCQSWIESILDEDLYFVDLFPEDVHNFYTVFFFRRRKEPNVIFAYPTLKVLALCLMEKFELKDKVMFSSEQEALKLFAGLGNEAEMLCTLKWLFTFGSEMEWDGYHLQNPASMLSSGFVRVLLDTALIIRRENYWRLQSALPTMETVSDGLYTLMEFKDGKNTGCLCAQESEGKMYPMFFKNKSSALHYKRGKVQYDSYHAMAVDDYYWNTLYESLKPDIHKWCLYVNDRQGILFDAEVYSLNLYDKL